MSLWTCSETTSHKTSFWTFDGSKDLRVGLKLAAMARILAATRLQGITPLGEISGSPSLNQVARNSCRTELRFFGSGALSTPLEALTESLRPATLYAIVGVPTAAASLTTSPQPSLTDVAISTCARARRSIFRMARSCREIERLPELAREVCLPSVPFRSPIAPQRASCL